MELYNSHTMPLSIDPEVRILQEKQLRGEKLSFKEVMFLDKKGMGGRDHTITKIGDYECKPDHCYRCISENTLEIYKQNGFIIDDRRVDYVEGQNNQGIDWYLGGAMPGRYGNIIIECPADKSFFKPTRDGGYGMSNDIHVRHMKSSPQHNPVPLSMITNIFDYKKIKEQAKAEFDAIRQQEMAKMAQLREQQLMSLNQSAPTDENTMGKAR